MRVVCLLYHDVIEGNNWDSSGFTGPGTARYKLSRAEFAAHLGAIAKVRGDEPHRAHDLLKPGAASFPFLLTFDDGGGVLPRASRDCCSNMAGAATSSLQQGRLEKEGF